MDDGVVCGECRHFAPDAIDTYRRALAIRYAGDDSYLTNRRGKVISAMTDLCDATRSVELLRATDVIRALVEGLALVGDR